MSIKQHVASTLSSGNTFHEDYTTTTSYVERAFGFPAKAVAFVNDSDTDTVQISWDGATLAYTLASAEYKDLSADGKTSVYVKATTGGGKVRTTAT